MSRMHSELWEQLRMSLLIESGSGVPEEVMFPVQPEEGLDEPSKSIGWGTGRRADGRGRASGKRVVKSGPYEQSQSPGGGVGEGGEKLRRGRGWQGQMAGL